MDAAKLWEEPTQARPEEDAARAVHAAADALQADLDNLTITLRGGGSFRQMQAAVAAYSVHVETMLALRATAQRLAVQAPDQPIGGGCVPDGDDPEFCSTHEDGMFEVEGRVCDSAPDQPIGGRDE
jgi:hypothetical protein